MLAAFLIFVAAIAALAFVCGIALGRAGREQLRLEISSLRERLAASDARYTEARRITGELLEVVKEKVGLKTGANNLEVTWKSQHADIESVQRSMPDYIPPESKNCPECSVSVRADAWPQECPACHCVFGFGEV